MSDVQVVAPGAIAAPKGERYGSDAVIYAHNGCSLTVRFTGQGWTALFLGHRASHAWTLDEGADPGKGSRYDRRSPTERSRASFNEVWRSYLCGVFVWQAIRHSTHFPWPAPEDIEIDWTPR